MAVTHARLFGLTIASELPLPGLLPVSSDAPADVHIRLAKLAGLADITIPNVAAYAVRDGCEILVDARPDAPDRNVRLYLLGSAVGLLLHQRGLFPLHANAVEVDGRAIAIAAPSGAGKSTLAAWFHDQGHRLIGDDVCVLRAEENAVITYPGVPRLRLWGQTIEATGRSREGLERAYAGDDEWDKWDVPVAAAQIASEGLPLSAIYVLEDGPEIAIGQLQGLAAAKALFDHTYRGEYLRDTGTQTVHWRTVTTLLSLVPVFRVERPFDLTRLDALGAAVRAHVRARRPRTSAAAPSRR